MGKEVCLNRVLNLQSLCHGSDMLIKHKVVTMFSNRNVHPFTTMVLIKAVYFDEYYDRDSSMV